MWTARPASAASHKVSIVGLDLSWLCPSGSVSLQTSALRIVVSRRGASRKRAVVLCGLLDYLGRYLPAEKKKRSFFSFFFCSALYEKKSLDNQSFPRDAGGEAHNHVAWRWGHPTWVNHTDLAIRGWEGTADPGIRIGPKIPRGYIHHYYGLSVVEQLFNR
jgi:hypothetical protein